MRCKYKELRNCGCCRYFLEVRGVGDGNPYAPTPGYLDYASAGNYTLVRSSTLPA
jgi:hypothetical protein